MLYLHYLHGHSGHVEGHVHEALEKPSSNLKPLTWNSINQ
jgi:hypothetical protein